MKLVQRLTRTSRTYEGVTFEYGVPVELPESYSKDAIRTLIAWGWEEVAEAPPVVASPESTPPMIVVTPDPEFSYEPIPRRKRIRRRSE